MKTATTTKTRRHARADGKIVGIAVPQAPKPEEVMVDAIRECLSPEAIATIIAYLQPVNVDDAKAQRQVEMFSDRLTEAVGGSDRFNRLMERVGL